MTDFEHAKHLFRAACDEAYYATLRSISDHRRVTGHTEQMYLTLRAYNNAELLYQDCRELLWTEVETRAARAYHGGSND